MSLGRGNEQALAASPQALLSPSCSIAPRPLKESFLTLSHKVPSDPEAWAQRSLHHPGRGGGNGDLGKFQLGMAHWLHQRTQECLDQWAPTAMTSALHYLQVQPLTKHAAFPNPPHQLCN